MSTPPRPDLSGAFLGHALANGIPGGKISTSCVTAPDGTRLCEVLLQFPLLPGESLPAWSLMPRFDGTGEQQARKSVTIEHALEELRADMIQAERERLHTERTLEAVRELASLHGWLTVHEINPAGITLWLTHLAEENGNSGKTRNIKRGYLSRFLVFCTDRGWIATNPILSVSTARVIRRRARVVPTEAQVAKLIESVRGIRRKKDRWLVYLAAATTGLRHGTIKRLEWGHVHEEADPPHLDLPGKLLKGKEPAIVWLTAELAALLRQHRAEARGRRQVFECVPKWDHMLMDLAKAGIPQKDSSGATLTFHSFRHFASNRMKWAGGFTDQERASQNGHRSLEMTRSVYTDPSAHGLGMKIKALPALMAS